MFGQSQIAFVAAVDEATNWLIEHPVETRAFLGRVRRSYRRMTVDSAIPGSDRSEMLGKRLLDMSPAELDAVFDAAIERAGAVE